MIRITVELVPKGKEKYKRTIARADIVNDGTGDVNIGNYYSNLYINDPVTGEEQHIGRYEVKGFKRLIYPVWCLIGKVIEKMRKEEKINESI